VSGREYEIGDWRMRPFILACCAVILIAVGAAIVLDRFVQESSATAFTAPGARS